MSQHRPGVTGTHAPNERTYVWSYRYFRVGLETDDYEYHLTGVLAALAENYAWTNEYGQISSIRSGAVLIAATSTSTACPPQAAVFPSRCSGPQNLFHPTLRIKTVNSARHARALTMRDRCRARCWDQQRLIRKAQRHDPSQDFVPGSRGRESPKFAGQSTWRSVGSL